MGIVSRATPVTHQIAEILEAAHTSVLVALGPVPGTDIWQKVAKVRSRLGQLKAIVTVHGPSDPANRIHAFGDLSST